jgi:hypothetical protein
MYASKTGKRRWTGWTHCLSGSGNQEDSMREPPDAILDKLVDVAVYVLDQAEARRQRGQVQRVLWLP